MNNKCTFETFNFTHQNNIKTIDCPICGHMVALGLPHPDFNSKNMPVNLKELELQAMYCNSWHE